ncbi:hypothetical protein CHUAL_008181 [Chamberlinius hualienensis]
MRPSSCFLWSIVVIVVLITTTSDGQKCALKLAGSEKDAMIFNKLASSGSWFVQGTNRVDWDCMEFKFTADPLNSSNGLLNYTAISSGQPDTKSVYLANVSPGQYQLSYNINGPPVTTLGISQIYNSIDFDTVLIFDCSSPNKTVYYILHNKISPNVNSEILSHYEQLIKNNTGIDVSKVRHNVRFGDQCVTMPITIQKLSKRRKWYVQQTNSQLQNCVEFVFVVDPLIASDGFLIYMSYDEKYNITVALEPH